MTVLDVSAVAGFPCLRVLFRVGVLRRVSWSVRSRVYAMLFVGCAPPRRVLLVCGGLFCLSAIVWCAFRERTCVWCDMVHVGWCGCAFDGNRDCRLFFTV